MTEKFLSVAGQTVTEKVIEKSRFITTTAHVEGEEEAKAFVSAVRKKYADATHNCYAFIADEKGNFLRFSDDGEPQGTAGMPMLEVLKSNNLRQCAAVVTRYFGGIKLGAGGLVRAYAGAVAENIAAAKLVCYQPCVQSAYAVGYSEADAVNRFFAENDCSVISTDYADGVCYKVAVKSAEEEQFNRKLTDFVNGKVKIERLREYLFPFEI